MQVVLYHANCNDGLFAAYEIWRTNRKETLCIPITYIKFNKQTITEFIGDITSKLFNTSKEFSGFIHSKHSYLNAIPESRVYLVDIAVDPDKLQALSEVFQSVVVLDHHKSAKDMYLEAFSKDVKCNDEGGQTLIAPFPNTFVGFSNVHSGARYTYETLNPGSEVPYYIQLVSDYDTWKKKLPESDAFAAGIRGINPGSMEELDELVSDGYHETVKVGEYFDKNRQDRSINANKKRIEVDVVHNDKTYKAAVVCTSLDISSIVGNLLVTDNGYDIGMSYVIVAEDEVAWSIRSKTDLDCSFVSISFGGGGHAQASGFSTTLDQLVDILKTKKIIVQ